MKRAPGTIVRAKDENISFNCELIARVEVNGASLWAVRVLASEKRKALNTHRCAGDWDVPEIRSAFEHEASGWWICEYDIEGEQRLGEEA